MITARFVQPAEGIVVTKPPVRVLSNPSGINQYTSGGGAGKASRIANDQSAKARTSGDRLDNILAAVAHTAAAEMLGTGDVATEHTRRAAWHRGFRTAGDLPGHEFHGNQWTDVGAADSWGSKTHAWAKDLTKEQESALHAYTVSVRINETLRTGKDPSSDLVWGNPTGNGVDLTEVQQLKGLDEIFAKPEARLSEPVVVHRAWSNPEQIANVPAGATFTDEGFTSTSLVKSETKVFGERGSAQVEIRVPAGQRALYLGKTGHGKEWYASSAELLLNRGTTYRVVSNEKKGMGKRRMVLEVVS